MRALLSVYDKTGLEGFAQGLHQLGFELIASMDSGPISSSSLIPPSQRLALPGISQQIGNKIYGLRPAKIPGVELSRLRSGTTSSLVPLLMPLAVVVIPLIVPGPVMSGAGYILVRMGKVKAGTTMLRLGAGYQ